MPPAESTEVFKWLGETIGFWIQTGAFVLSAIAALVVIFVGSRRAKRKSTVDILLHNNTNPTLIFAIKKVAGYHAEKINFSQFASANLSAHPENEYIMAVLNNYEFIATGIKEGAFDEEIYRRMSRSLLLRDWSGLCPFVEHLRQATGKPLLYAEFEWLAERFRKNCSPSTISWYRRLAYKLGL